MEEVFATQDLLTLVLSEAERTAARLVCEAWRHEVDRIRGRPQPPQEVASLRDGSWDAPLTKGKLSELLVLAPAEVATYPHIVRRRYGGGEYHVFDPATVLRAFQEHGGIDQLALRLCRKQSRARRADTASQAAHVRVTMLNRGLAAIGVPPRSDSYWQSRSVGSANFWKENLSRTLRHAARMHWLHEHTEGRYQAAVEDEVESLAEDAEHYFRGIYDEAVYTVQRRSEFSLPAEGLPWLTTGETTAESLARAEAIADPQQLQRKRRREGVQERRVEAKVARRRAFDRCVAERFAGLPAPPLHVWGTSARVRAFLERDTIKAPRIELEEAVQAVDAAARAAAHVARIDGARWEDIRLDLSEAEVVHRLRLRAQERARARSVSLNPEE